MKMNEVSFNQKNWGVGKKISFRFIFIFFLLFIIIQNNEAYPYWYYLMKYPTELLHKIIPWIGKHILNLPSDITVFTNGSGDTTYDYVIVLTVFVLGVIGAIIWSFVDRKRESYNSLYYWLTVAVRYYIALMLVSYGLFKVIKLQFPDPSFYRLTQNYGDSSPMGLAWTFLGFSKGYNMFMGIAEIAAVLLLFRRTMTAGAIITLMTAANIMAVNYFYDIPVKIISTALVLMTFFLLFNDLKRLYKFFFTGESISLPIIKPPRFKRKWMRYSKMVLKILIIGYALGYGTLQTWGYKKQFGDEAPKPKFYGLYEVDRYIKNSDTLPQLITDTVRWRQFIVQREGSASIRYMSDSIGRFNMNLDTVLKKVDFEHRKDSTIIYSYKYETPSTSELNFIGMMGKDSVSIFMKKKDLKEFRLINRGFNWISEYPYNR